MHNVGALNITNKTKQTTCLNGWTLPCQGLFDNTEHTTRRHSMQKISM